MKIPEKEQTHGREEEVQRAGLMGGERETFPDHSLGLDLGHCNQRESNLTASNKRGGQCARPQSSQGQLLLDLEDKKEVNHGWALVENDRLDWFVVEGRTVTENS